MNHAYRGGSIEPYLFKQIETGLLHHGAEVFAEAQVRIVIQVWGRNQEGRRGLEETGYILARSLSIKEIILDRRFPE